jgi:hypothetical protein
MTQRTPSIWTRQDRPKMLGLLGYLCLALGYVGFILFGTGLFPFFVDARKLNPKYIYPDVTPFENLAAMLYLVFMAILCLTLLAGGIGLLRMKFWGKRVVTICACVMLSLIVLKFLDLSIRLDRHADLQMQATTQPLVANEVKQALLMHGLISSAMFAVFPLIALTILTRRYINEALARANSPAT